MRAPSQKGRAGGELFCHQGGCMDEKSRVLIRLNQYWTLPLSFAGEVDWRMFDTY